MKAEIKHIWFDFAGTLYKETAEFLDAHDKLLYESYSRVVEKEVSDQTKKEYKELYSKHGSNSAVFRSLGLPSDHWQKEFDKLDVESILKPDPETYQSLDRIRSIVPISLFTNFKHDKITKLCKILDIDLNWFSFIISGDDVKERKPSLDGFKLMIEKSQLLPQNLLYVGDRVDVDIKPAKELGMQTCLVYSHSNVADYSIEKLDEILSILK